MGATSPSQTWGPAAPGFLFLEIPQPQHPSCCHPPSAGFLALIPFVTAGETIYIYIYNAPQDCR